MKYSAALLAAIGSVQAGLEFGSCPENIPFIPRLRKEKYVGRWYEKARDWTTNFEWFGECTTATYRPRKDKEISVENRAWFWWTFFDYYQVDGSAACNNLEDGTTSGKCYVNFTGDQTRAYEDDLANYHVVDTDYETFSLVYSCSVPWWGLTALKWDLLWVLSRDEP